MIQPSYEDDIFKMEQNKGNNTDKFQRNNYRTEWNCDKNSMNYSNDI